MPWPRRTGTRPWANRTLMPIAPRERRRRRRRRNRTWLPTGSKASQPPRTLAPAPDSPSTNRQHSTLLPRFTAATGTLGPITSEIPIVSLTRPFVWTVRTCTIDWTAGSSIGKMRPSMVKANRLAVHVLILGAILLYAILANAWIVDDAYITFRSIWNVHHGFGLRWNPSERVQTYTHPLWMLLISGF